MSPESQQFPLLCVAVAKFSLQYWIERLANLKSPWPPMPQEWPWRADAEGAVSGAIAGSIAGGITAGVGGAVIGGVAGAVGGVLVLPLQGFSFQAAERD